MKDKIMKKQSVIFVSAICGMMTLCACSKEVMNDKWMERDSQLTVLTRGDGGNGDPVIATPIRLYVFDSEDQCIAAQTEEGTGTPISMKLPEGTFAVYAIGGADDSRLDLPTQEAAEKTSVISLKEGKTLDDLMTAYATVTLSSKGSNTLTLGMERKVCQIVSATITNVPDETEEVSISISPFYESILLNGSYHGENGTCTIPLVKQADSNTWEETTGIYQLSSVGKPTISVRIDNSTYSYTCEEELGANYKITIEGTYTGPNIMLSGTITGVAWSEEKSIQFTFNEDGSETVDEESTPVPEVGSLYQGCYVLAVDGKQVTILSSEEKNGIVTNNDGDNTIKTKINNELQKWSVPNITAEWKLIDENALQLIESAAGQINSPELNAKNYFFTNGSTVKVFNITNGNTNYSGMPTGITYLRPVATLTFE
jgi:hypothetical protein